MIARSARRSKPSIDRIMAGVGGRSRHARVSLRPLRALRPQAADGPLRDAAETPRSAAARRALRRPSHGGPSRRARRRRELLDQAARTRSTASRGRSPSARPRCIDARSSSRSRASAAQHRRRRCQEAVERYNRDDCRSTLALRDWLEALRADAIADGSRARTADVEAAGCHRRGRQRAAGATSQACARELLRGRAGRCRAADRRAAAAMAARVPARLAPPRGQGGVVGVLPAQRPARRGSRSTSRRPSPGWSSSRVSGDVLNKKTGRPTGSVVDRYRYPPQEMEIRDDDELKLNGREQVWRGGWRTIASSV